MITNSDHSSPVNVISDHHFVHVLKNKLTGQKSLHAASHFQPGQVICRFSAGKILGNPTYLTLQTGIKRHITLIPEFLQYTNHSCDPTAFFNTTSMEFICLSPLQPGDELTFFYPSTEWDMAQPFSCHCGSPECLHVISGAAHLSPDILEKYALNEFIRQEIKRRILI